MTDQFTGQTLADKYRIDALLSDSDLGKIYSATNLLVGKPVSIKILSPALAVDESIVRQFSTEARTASQINHPNILNVTDFGSDANGTVYTVFEGIEGKNLKEVIAADGKFEPARAIDLAKQIASALSAAHEHNVNHGALSAQDVVIAKNDGRETVKVLNFASVKVPASTEEDDESRDIAWAQYASPEQCSDSGETDGRSDIYSLGVILYEMLAGAPPFTGEKATEIMLKHVEEQPPALAEVRKDLSPDLEPALFKALSKDPPNRYQTADEFAAALDLVSVSATSTKAAAAGTNIWKTAFIVMVGTMLLAAALIYATSGRRTNPTSQLMPDANGVPVQPINPVSGADDMRLSGYSYMTPSGQMTMNSNMPMGPDVMPGGDGYNPWASSSAPPGGAPMPAGPEGQRVTIDPNGGSQFMPQGDGSVILVPVEVDPNTGRPIQNNPGGNPPATSPDPDPDPAGTKPAATPADKPATKPNAKPTPSRKPADKNKPADAPKAQSGKLEDSKE